MALITRKVRWIVVAAALVAAAIGSSPGSREVSARTRYIGIDHMVSSSPLPPETGVMCPLPEAGDTSYQARGGAAGGGAASPAAG